MNLAQWPTPGMPAAALVFAGATKPGRQIRGVRFVPCS